MKAYVDRVDAIELQLCRPLVELARTDRGFQTKSIRATQVRAARARRSARSATAVNCGVAHGTTFRAAASSLLATLQSAQAAQSRGDLASARAYLSSCTSQVQNAPSKQGGADLRRAAREPGAGHARNPRVNPRGA